MNKVARILLEYTDFIGFSKLHTNMKANTYHITHVEWIQKDDAMWMFVVRADRFLQDMVRVIAGTLIEVGWERLIVEGLQRIIEQ